MSDCDAACPGVAAAAVLVMLGSRYKMPDVSKSTPVGPFLSGLRMPFTVSVAISQPGAAGFALRSAVRPNRSNMPAPR